MCEPEHVRFFAQSSKFSISKHCLDIIASNHYSSNLNIYITHAIRVIIFMFVCFIADAGTENRYKYFKTTFSFFKYM